MTVTSKVATLKQSVSPAARPLRALAQPALEQRFNDALKTADGLLGAHCIHEAWMRGAMSMQIEVMQQALWQRAAETIPDWLPMSYVSWLSLAYEVSATFAATRRGRSHLYLILLDYSDRRGEPYGVYVGMTRHAPAARFDQHKAGIRASTHVTRRGVELLMGPVLHLQRISLQDATRIEMELAAALRDAGLRVQGGH